MVSGTSGGIVQRRVFFTATGIPLTEYTRLVPKESEEGAFT
jgi:hypothetical protein